MAGCEKTILGPGWNISPEGFETLTQNGSIKDQRSIYQNALDSDLKEIGAQVLNTEITKSKIDELVLQIHKVRNIAAPKANEESQAAPRMLKLTLTDGHTFCQGIEIENIPQLSVDRTAPGAKVLLKNAPLKAGYLLLNPACCTYLGGKVPALYEKWEISRSLLKNTRRRASNPDGPPAWVNFGKKISSTDDTTFKSLNNNKDTPKQDTEFENQRKGAIAEVASGAVKKVFGGGVKKFSDAQAERDKQFNLREQQRGAFRDKRRNEGRGKIVVEEGVNNKPPEKVCLFNFLEDKLNDSQPVTTTQSFSNENTNNRAFEKFANPPQKYEYNTNKSQSSAGRYNQQQSREPQFYNKRSVTNQQQNTTSYNKNGSAETYQNHTGRYTNQQQSKEQQNNAFYNKKSTTNDPYNTQQQQNYKSSSTETYQNHAGRYTNQQQSKEQQNNAFYNKKSATNESYNTQQRQNNANGVSNGSAETQSTSVASVNSITNSMGRLSVNSQFASRSLKQHLNLNKTKKEETVVAAAPKSADWKIGDNCLAKYWEDGKFYNASITNITENTLVVLFTDYGNVEEVLKTDCKPAGKSYRPTQRYYSRKPFAGKPDPRKRPDNPA